MTWAGEFAGTRRFEPVRRLGAGGMGVVFEVFDRERDEHVALKTLRHASAQSLYYLKKEFRALEGMHHPNLIRLLELIESDGRWFFTMELVRGANFLSYVRGSEQAEIADTLAAVDGDASVSGPRGAVAPVWDEARLRRGLAGVLDGLSALHECGMIHRDIKPSNVMVAGGERVVLLDFGLAEALARRRHLDGDDQRLMGTPAYMSPEQFDSAELSPASDLYSVGVTLYEAFTGRLPHNGTIAEVMEACKSPPLAPSEIAPGVPGDLDELCMALLRYDPASRPTVVDARRALGGAASGPRYRRPLTPRPGTRGDVAFVGRAQHVAELRASLERVRAGRPDSVLVEGASGIGKTALVRHFLRGVEEESDAVVLMGRCYENESVPYKAFDSLVDELGRYLRNLSESSLAELLPDHADALVRLFPVLELPDVAAVAATNTSPSELRSRAFAALKQLLRRLARRGALVLFIDDLQWGDADSGALLRELLREPDAPAMLFIATCRRGAADDPTIAAAAAELRRIRLEALPGAESRELIGRISGAQQSKLARWLDDIVREAKGNPFFIGEIVRYLTTRRADAGADGAVLLQRVVEERVAGLPDDAAEALRAAAVIGRPVPLRLLCDVSGLDVAEGRRAIDLLVAANMLRVDRDNAVGVYHDRLREAVVAELPPRTVRDVYRRMHAALEQSGSDARHAELLGLDYVAESEPERALEYAIRAAELAESAFAFGRAARLYELAVELAPEAERRALMRRHARVLHDGGYGADAARVYLALAAGADNEEALQLTRLAADDLLRSGHIEQGLAQLGDVARQLGVRVGRSRTRTVLGIVFNRARLALRGLRYEPRAEGDCEPRDLARLDTLFAAATALGIVDHLNGTLLQTEHMLGALRVGEERRVWRAVAAEVVFLCAQGGRAAERAEALRQRLARRADELDDPFLRAGCLIGRAYLSLFGGRYRDARASFEAAHAELQECPDAWWERNTARYWGLLTTVTMGDYNEVASALPRMIRAAEERNDRYMRSVLRTHPTVFHLLREDRAAEADAELDAALEDWSGDRRYVAHYTVMISRVALRLYQQRPGDALEILHGARSLMRELLVHRVPFAKSEVDKLTAVAAVALGDERRAKRAIRALEGFGIPISRAYGAMYRAPLALARGDRDAALRLVESAGPIFEEAGAAHDVAAARFRAGQLRGDAAQQRAARDWFETQGVVDPDRMIDYIAPGFPSANTS